MRAPGRTFDALANGGVQTCEKGSVPEGFQLVSPKATVFGVVTASSHTHKPSTLPIVLRQCG
jgi:hypothetical protein